MYNGKQLKADDFLRLVIGGIYMNSKSMYIAIIIGSVALVIVATVIVFMVLLGGQGEYIPYPAQDETFYTAETPTPETNNNDESARPDDEYETTMYSEDDDTEDEPDGLEPTIPVAISDGPIRWHIHPNWNFHQVFNFSEGMAAVEYFEDGFWESMHILGYINRIGEIVIPVEHRHYPEMYAYRGAPPFSEGLVAIRSEENGAMGVFDTQGNQIVPFEAEFAFGWNFQEGLMAVRQGGWEQMPDGDWSDQSRWGFIDSTGRTAIPLEFQHAENFRDGLAAVMLAGYWGFINTDGEVVIDFIINVATDDGHGFLIIPSFSEGLVAVSTGGWEQDENDRWFDTTTWGFMNREGNQVIPFDFTNAGRFSGGVAPVMIGHHNSQDEDGNWYSSARWGVIDQAGNTVVPFEYTWIGNFVEGVAIAFPVDGDGVVLLDRSGTVIVPSGRYTNIHDFSEGLAAVRAAYTNGGEPAWGFINRHGYSVINPRFNFVGAFSEGFAPVSIGGWEDVNGERINNERWGFIDREGNVVVPIEFHEVRAFSEGLAWVRQGDLWGLLEIR